MRKLEINSIQEINKKLYAEIQQVLGSICPDQTLQSRIGAILKHVDLSDVDAYLKSNLKHNHKLLLTTHSKYALLVLYSLCDSYQTYKDIIEETLYILAVIYYNQLLNKYVRYCDPLVLQYSFSYVKGTNLFKKKESVKDVLSYLSSEMAKKANTCEVLNIVKLLYILRHRIAQSLKSIMIKYYQISQNKLKYIKVKPDNDRAIQQAIQQILFYGNVKIPQECNKYQMLYDSLPLVDEDLLYQSLKEILEIFAEGFSKKRFVKVYTKLRYTMRLLKELHLPDNALYCLSYILYVNIKGDQNERANS